MSKEEILAAIRRELPEDTWANQAQNASPYKGKNRAHYLEAALFLCPQCKQLGTLHSQGNHLRCACGMDVTLTEQGFFAPAEPFATIAQWDQWQLDAFRKEAYSLPADSIGDENITYLQITDDHQAKLLHQGRLCLQKDLLTIGQYQLPLADITNMAIVRTNRLIFSLGSAYYELKSQTPGCCLRKYLLAWQNARAANHQTEG